MDPKAAGLAAFLKVVEGDGMVLAYERDRCRARLDAGDAKYGPGSWRSHDHLAEAIAETVDLVNYCYLRWLQLQEQAVASQVRSSVGEQLVFLAREALVMGRNLAAVKLQLAGAGVPASLDGLDLVGV